MGPGNDQKVKVSPIVLAIAEAEKHTTAEIRVHLTRRFFERDPFGRAQKLFADFGMRRTANRNGVLIYVNLRKHKFAIIGDTGIHEAVGQVYWDQLAVALANDLKKEKFENAIAVAVLTVGETLRKFFPLETAKHNPNELPDLVTES